MALREALGHEQLTGISVGTTLTVPAGATRALMIATAQNVRWRDDGGNATASIGILIKAGSTKYFEFKGDLAACRLSQVAIGAILDVTYY